MSAVFSALSTNLRPGPARPARNITCCWIWTGLSLAGAALTTRPRNCGALSDMSRTATSVGRCTCFSRTCAPTASSSCIPPRVSTSCACSGECRSRARRSSSNSGRVTLARSISRRIRKSQAAAGGCGRRRSTPAKGPTVAGRRPGSGCGYARRCCPAMIWGTQGGPVRRCGWTGVPCRCRLPPRWRCGMAAGRRSFAPARDCGRRSGRKGEVRGAGTIAPGIQSTGAEDDVREL